MVAMFVSSAAAWIFRYRIMEGILKSPITPVTMPAIDFTMLVWIAASWLIFTIWRCRHYVWNLYRSFLVWKEIRKAKMRLRAINRHDLADSVKWDGKWFGDL